MKVLVTGFTRRQCGLPQRKHYRTVFQCMTAALDSLDEIEWVQKAVYPGEDLSEFDCALIGQHDLGSMASAPHKFGALYAALQLPHVFVMEDWKMRGALLSWDSQPKLFNYSLFSGSKKGIEVFDAAAKFSKEMDAMRMKYAKRFPVTILPAFEWAEVDAFPRETEGLFTWDPSPFFYLIGDDSQEKERRWVNVAQSSQQEWQRKQGPYTWEVYDYLQKPEGTSKKGGGGPRSPWMDEPDLVAEYYNKSWGILMPHYGTTAMMRGWWRSRPNLSEQCGCVIVSDENELAWALGDAYRVNVQQVEAMSDDELEDVARKQQLALLSRQLTQAESAQGLLAALKACL
jgi:hypothetical protein